MTASTGGCLGGVPVGAGVLMEPVAARCGNRPQETKRASALLKAVEVVGNLLRKAGSGEGTAGDTGDGFSGWGEHDDLLGAARGSAVFAYLNISAHLGDTG